jgi:hypothetical protein
MNQFFYGLTWGLGFFCAFGVFFVAFIIILAGLVGIGNITKRGMRPPVGPTQ